MTGYCVIVTKGAAKTLHNVFLVDSREGVDPIAAIKEHCRQKATLPWPVQYWDDHPNDILWFPVRQVEKLKAIDWPIDCGTMEEEYKIQIQVYRAFEIYQVDYVKALEELDNEVINRALGLGWEPKSLKNALNILANAMSEKDQAETYRESIIDMVEDVAEAVEATEEIYQYDADNFLEEDGQPSGPKDPKDMTDEELIDEAKQLHGAISVSDCFGVVDLVRRQKIEDELTVSRGYEICISSGYTVQNPEEE